MTDQAVKEGKNIGNGLFRTYFDFYDLGKLQELNLLTTTLYPIFGIGCGGQDKVKSEGKKIEVALACMQIDPNYYTDGKIILQIN